MFHSSAAVVAECEALRELDRRRMEELDRLIQQKAPKPENASVQTRCKRGHPLDGIRSNGWRYCKICQRRHQRHMRKLIAERQKEER